MPCNYNANCGCNMNIKSFGVCDVSQISLNGRDRTVLNWSQISVPEVVPVPMQKPDIEHLDQVYVDAVINCAQLIETPFAYQSYERQATAFEVTTALNALGAVALIDLTAITAAVNAILAIPGLPAIPAVVALQNAYNAVLAAEISLTAVVTAAQTAIGAACVAASVVVAQLRSVLAALAVLTASLQALIVAANALVAATAAIPIVGPAVAAAVATLLTDINTVLTAIEQIVIAIVGAITVIGNTSVFVISPNAEGTCLSGRKIVIDGALQQKVVYTALVPSQTVHSFCNQIPFSAYIIPYASFTGLTYAQNIPVIADPAVPCTTILVNGFAYDPTVPIVVNLNEDFCVNSCIEDIFATAVDSRQVFKNITLFLSAKPVIPCG